MDIRPILSTLARHKTAAALIVLEVALSCAIICNAVFLITQRLERIATQLLTGSAHPGRGIAAEVELVTETIRLAKELIKQLDALAIAE